MNLKLQNLEVKYGNREIVRGIDYIFEEGKIYVLLGPNGCGKSTLLRQMIKEFAGKEELSYISQETTGELEMTAEEVVALGRFRKGDYYHVLDQNDYKLIEGAMCRTDTEKIRNLSYDILSGGEKQRIQIARAIVKNHKWLIADEPTASLDIKHQVGFIQMVRELKAEGKSIILVLHDLNMAATLADQVILMREGKFIRSGVPNEVLTEQNLTDIFETHFKVINDETNGSKIIYNV